MEIATVGQSFPTAAPVLTQPPALMTQAADQWIGDVQFPEHKTSTNVNQSIATRPAVNERIAYHGNLPQLKLEPFDGNFSKWPDFAADFKALVHDAPISDYQRMAYLRMHLSPAVRSIFDWQLRDPSCYPEAFQALRSRYGDTALVAKANINALSNLPPVKVDDFRSLEKFDGCLNDVVASLLKSGHSQELNSILVMEHVFSKLPISLRKEWGHESVRLRRSTGLLDFQKWL